MGIIDKVTGLLPRRNERSDDRATGGSVLALRHDFDRWFQRFVDEPWSVVTGGTERFAPSVDVRETPNQVIVTAEVPGLDPQDVELAVVNGALLIRGEKRETTEETREDVHVSELRYGSFARSIPLPRGVDPDKAEAEVKKGVLTVKFPKTNQTAGRIPVRT
jgi:HSP20 family protein